MIANIMMGAAAVFTFSVFIWAFVIMDPRGIEIDHTYPLLWKVSYLFRHLTWTALDHFKLLPKVPDRKILPPENYQSYQWAQNPLIVETLVVSAVEYADLKIRAYNAEARLENLKASSISELNKQANQKQALKNEAEDWQTRYSNLQGSFQRYDKETQKEITDLRQTLTKLTKVANEEMVGGFPISSRVITAQDKLWQRMGGY